MLIHGGVKNMVTKTQLYMTKQSISLDSIEIDADSFYDSVLLPGYINLAWICFKRSGLHVILFTNFYWIQGFGLLFELIAI